MSIWNGYCTLDELKRILTPAKQVLDADDTDDIVIEDIIERASRKFDGLMSREFYPHIDTKYYNVPEDDYLWFGDDLLAVISLTNGDATSIAATEYHFKPMNEYPKYALYLTDVTSTLWEEKSTSSTQEAITLVGIFGYREKYATQAWVMGSTLNEGAGLNATDTTFTVTSGTLFKAGQIIKIENELMIIDSVSTNDITVIQRGDNGSTAATHVNATPTYYWRHPDDIVNFVLAMALMEYKARYQPQAVDVTSYMSPAGIVTQPRSLPVDAKDMINRYRRRV